MWVSEERSRYGQCKMAIGVKAARLWVRLSLHVDNLHSGLWYAHFQADGNKAGEIWAIALSEDGQYLAATSFDGRINVWDNLADGAKIRDFETKGSFGMSIDLVWHYTPWERSIA